MKANVRLCQVLSLGFFVAALFVAAPAHAQLRVTLEPGIGTIKASSAGRSLGVLGGVAVGLVLNEQVWLEARFDRRQFLSYKPEFAATTGGLSLVYAIDVLDVRPYFELGLAYVALSYLDHKEAARRPALERGVVPVLGVGFDTKVRDWLWAGLGLRYLPILDSDIQDDPAYAMISLRLTGIWRW